MSQPTVVVTSDDLSAGDTPSHDSHRDGRGLRIPDGFGVGLAIFTILFALQLLRQHGNPSWQTVWAEDGKYYAAQAIRQGGLHVLFQGYAGYLQLPPRLIAVFTPLLPVRDLAPYYAFAGVLVGTLLAWFLYYATEGWIASRTLRVALAALLVLMPASGKENTANAVNLIWTFGAVLPWALVSLKEGTAGTAVRAVVAFLGAAASLLSFLLLPLAVVWVIVHRTRSAMIVVASLFAGLVLQAGVSLRSPQRPSAGGNEVGHLVYSFMARVVAFYAVGVKPVHHEWQSWGGQLIVGSALLLVVLFAVLFPGAGRRAQGLAAVFLGYAVTFYVVPVWGRGVVMVYPPPGRSFALTSTRYSVMPVLFIASAAAVLIAPRAVAARHRLAARVVMPLFLAQLVIVGVTSYPAVNAVSVGATWSQLVSLTYDSTCVGAPPDTPVVIMNHNSSMSLTCKDLSP